METTNKTIKKSKPRYYKTLDGKILIRKTYLGDCYKTNLPKHSKVDETKYELKEIKNQEYSRLMNSYFRNLKDEWEYKPLGTSGKYQTFMKLPNFESCADIYRRNNLVWHDIGSYNKALIVYHWGKIYYFLPMYGGIERGRLLDLTTKEQLRWTQARNVAPIFNLTSNRYV